MTLAEMRPGDVGVMLSIPKRLAHLHLCPGSHVRLITTHDGLSLVDAAGERLAVCASLAREMILAAYYE